jgi:hypothetical protein
MAVPDTSHVDLGRRVGDVRRELYGDSGGPALAEALGLPAETWANYERGVIIPGPVILAFIKLTGADPHWLFTGEGGRYMARRATTGAASPEGRPNATGGP